jgi:DNA-binding GntR family transcriptional regulator
MNRMSIPRADFVYDWVKNQIRSGTLEPGTRLTEAEIAKQIGVSRTPVREAINRLLSEGQLSHTSARGFSVSILTRQQIMELYALREFLEGASARFAAHHASPGEIEALRELLEEAVDLEVPQKLASFNRRFHREISSAGHNRYSEKALAQMADSLELVPGTTFELRGRAEDVHREHLAILDAIASRDPDAAEEAARLHIRNASKARLKQLFGQL